MPRKKPGPENPELDALVQQVLATGDPMGVLNSLMDQFAPTPAFMIKENEPITVPPAPKRPSLLTVRIDLHGAKPPIWRRLELRGDVRLDRVHDHIQAAMGWTNSHLHRFSEPNKALHQGNYFVTQFDIDEGDEGTLESDVRLDQVLRTAGEFVWYEYDFGDSWDHKIVVEKVEDAPRNAPEARCIDGRMACPPEDVGGIGFWNELAAALRAVGDPRQLPNEYKDYRSWLAANIDPGAFSVAEANVAIEHAGDMPLDWSPEHPPTAYATSALRQLLLRCPPDLSEHLAELALKASARPDASADEFAHALRPWQAVLDAANPNGIALTKAGWMAPDACEHIWHAGGFAWSYGKGNREQHTPELSVVREACTAAKLIRKHKDRLVLTPLGRKAVNDPNVLAAAAIEPFAQSENQFTQDACVLTLLLLASGFEPSHDKPFEQEHEFEDEVARMMSALGWSVGNGPVHRHELGSAQHTLTTLLKTSNEESVRWGMPSAPGARQLARLAVIA